MRRSLLALGLLASLGSCAAPGSRAEHTWSWVWILTGPNDSQVQGAARSEVFAGHFGNMARMAESGDLLLAGPFAEPRAQADHRGVFVLATEDSEHASEIANSDPTAQAGVFRFEIEIFRTNDDFQNLMAMHTEAVAQSGVADPPPGFHARPYVLLEGAPASAAEFAVDRSKSPVLFSGRIGDGAQQRALFCLDASTADEAQRMIAAMAVSKVHWTVMPWFATEEVTRLRGTVAY